jgi:hypothetical protein
MEWMKVPAAKTENGLADLVQTEIPKSLGPYLITLSARASTLGGIVRPICLAALRLTINSNFFGCSTGRSPALAHL